jgi:hypothetical protein
LAKKVLTENDKRDLMVMALELSEIRKLVEKLAETLVKLSDKDLLRFINASQEGVREKQVDRYKETLEKQIDIAEKEFRL